MAVHDYVRYYADDDIYEDTGEDTGTGAGSGNESGKSSGKDSDPDDKPDIRFRTNEARSGSVMRIILISVFAAAFLGSVIYSLNKRNTMYNKVTSCNQQLNAVEAENVRLQSELDSRMSAKNVEDYAVNELHMQKIDSSQIKYIEIQTGDVVNIPQQDENLWTKISDFFDSCVEYFRG